jgi:hypothetical protein
MPDHAPIPLRDAAERVRRLGQRTPWWELSLHEGQPVVIDSGVHQVVFSIHGMWTPDLVWLLTVYGTNALLSLAELLWMISADGGSRRVVSAARTFVAALDLDGHRTPAEIKAFIAEWEP